MNEIYSHPQRCDQYIKCVVRTPIIMECRRNTRFDVVQKKCVPAAQAACLRRIGAITFKAGRNLFFHSSFLGYNELERGLQ